MSMHRHPSRENLLYGLVLGVCLAIVAVAWWHHQQARRRAAEVVRDHQQIQTLVRRLEQLKQRPALAGSDELELAELSRLIEQAARDAGIPLDRLVRIWPEQPQRVRDSVYLEKPTQILFRGVTLRQFTTFLHGISHAGTGLRIKSLRITAPRDEPESETWIVEATLTYLIYAPAS